MVGLEITDIGGTEVFITEIKVGDALYELSPALWFGPSGGPLNFQREFDWTEGKTYNVSITTEIGNTIETAAIADQ